MNDPPRGSSQLFESRFRPREFRNVAILLFPEDITADDESVFRTGLESMVSAGIRGFTWDLCQFGRHRTAEEALGHLVPYLVAAASNARGAVNWLHGARFVQEWRRLKLLGIPPENFETEAETLEAWRGKLEAACVRTDLAKRLGDCGLSASDIANRAGLFESDVRRIAAGEYEPSDVIVLRISSVLDAFRENAAQQWVVLPAEHAAGVLRQPSRAVPVVDATWTPEASIIEEIAPALTAALQPRLDTRNAKAAAPPGRSPRRPLRTSDYFVQCIGIIRGGQQLVYLNGCHRWLIARSGSKLWRTAPIVVCDGGSSLFGAEYDPVTRQISALIFNGPYGLLNPLHE
jgi:hypothetical protein